ncbi:MAG: serine hydroxymethyltransferase, partial [Thermoplasmata archaeon]|nr:serine hydroxymethyltransferase [Thermoplasmata archaeon]
LTWRIFDNAHWNRIAALGQTLLEMERMGAEYARTVIDNARALATAVHALGVPAMAEELGFTSSHQVQLDARGILQHHQVSVSALARRWESQRLITDLVGRLGTAEVARLGLVPSDMPRIAELLLRAGLKRERVAGEVLAWRRQFKSLRFA